MIKSFKKENGVLVSTKVITEGDILDIYKEARLYAFEICNNSCNFGFLLNNKKIKFEEINKDNVLNVLLDASSYFNEFFAKDKDIIEVLTKRYIKSVGLDKKDPKSLFDSIFEFVTDTWVWFSDFHCDSEDFYVFNSKVNYLVEDNLNKEELDFFSDFITEHDLDVTFVEHAINVYDYASKIFSKIINSEEYVKELLSGVISWREINEQ